jgi:NTE family protein
MASGKNPIQMCEEVKSFVPLSKYILSPNYYFWQPARKMGLFNLNKLEKKLNDYVCDKFCHCKNELIIVCSDVERKETIYFSSLTTPNKSVSEAVRMSCSVPMLFVPGEYNKRLIVDGGLTDNFSLDYYKNNKNIIGIRLISSDKKVINKGVIKRKINNKKINSRFDYISSLIETPIEELHKKRLEDSIYAKIVNIYLPYKIFDFWSIKEKDVDKMWEEGYKQTKIGLDRILRNR